MPNLVKILSEQSRILFLISNKLRQAFKNFYSTYNEDVVKLAT
ncbi:6395_t:CDS:2 [Cetraspora pellucida]|uniref:6395_t:CDS:1 n=1 Tax=Cetraspora pellucida TaxID=1433469 RepID=A0A9N9H2B8_9GLOM|nr:6395_t:CDS:2 [Cetraspora pellucida]